MPEPPTERHRAIGARLEWAVEPGAGSGTRWEQTRLPRRLAALGTDVLFAPAYTAPVRCPCPFVVLIHDLSYFAHPEWFSWRDGLRRRWLTRTSARRARTVVTVSEFSRSETASRLRVPAARLLIASPGPPAVTASGATAREPLVLYVGTLLARRRIPELLEAFARVASLRPEARLVLVGANRSHPPIDPAATLARLGLGGRVEWRAYVDDRELADLYAAARVFAFLSDYEGFAMTPMEALAAGVPPVLLDTPVAREVYAGAARFVAPTPASIADALGDLLDRDDDRNAILAGRAAVLNRFSWDRTASTVLGALEEAAR
jgi:glycosyltransferase involved in cell wall biosynthesis